MGELTQRASAVTLLLLFSAVKMNEEPLNAQSDKILYLRNLLS
jgi:hypothetical protein